MNREFQKFQEFMNKGTELLNKGKKEEAKLMLNIAEGYLAQFVNTL